MKSKAYVSWYSAKRRCFNPKDAGYANYGGRGITIDLDTLRRVYIRLAAVGNAGEQPCKRCGGGKRTPSDDISMFRPCPDCQQACDNAGEQPLLKPDLTKCPRCGGGLVDGVDQFEDSYICPKCNHAFSLKSLRREAQQACDNASGGQEKPKCNCDSGGYCPKCSADKLPSLQPDPRDARITRLEGALRRVRQGYQNILEFRQLTADVWGTRDGYGGRYGALTREEIDGVLTEIDAALAPTEGGE